MYIHVSTKLNKLRTYCLFKTSFCQENYVHLLNRNQRSVFCKLRISAHSLMIEKGRYSYPKIPSENRICTKCDLQETEDEFHFIMKCKAYDNLRKILLYHIKDIYNTDNLSDKDLFLNSLYRAVRHLRCILRFRNAGLLLLLLLKIMSASDYDTLKVVCNYICSAFEIHSHVTTS